MHASTETDSKVIKKCIHILNETLWNTLPEWHAQIRAGAIHHGIAVVFIIIHII